MRTPVTRKTLGPIRWAVIPDRALAPPLIPPRARIRLGRVIYRLDHSLDDSALVPAGHDNGDAVSYHRAGGRKSRACHELGRKPHRNVDCTVGLVPSRFPFPLFLSLS